MNNKRMKNPMNSERNGSTICPSFEGGKCKVFEFVYDHKIDKFTFKQD